MDGKKILSVSKILLKSLRLGLKVKSPVSLVISILAVPMAIMPLILSKQLQKITDLLLEFAMNVELTSINLIKEFIFLGLFFLLQWIFQAVVDYNTIRDTYRTKFYIKDFVSRKICGVHYSYIENRDDFLKKIEFVDTYAAEEMSSNIQCIFVVLQQFITFFSIAWALWNVHPSIVLIILATGIPSAILAYKQSDETFQHRVKWSDEGRLTLYYYGICASSWHGIQEVRHYELFDYMKARWRALSDSYIFQKNKMTGKHLKANLLADFLNSAVYLVILFVIVWKIFQNPAIGLGVFTLTYTLSDRLQKVTGNILTKIMQFSASLLYLREFFSLEDLEHEEVTNEENAVSQDINGSISFDNVSFSYPGCEKEVLHDISVSIRGGEKIAVVGDNGSGKSTFISLLTGMFQPNKGKVEIDGLSMELHKQKLRKRISVIFQDFAHYEGTLRENITISDIERKLSDEEIMALARKIHVEDVIEEQQQGLSSMLGRLSSKGNNLSGGQWQKIALLRAVYRENTDIMILDEPTAALDPLSEAELYRSFTQITGDRTTLLISHRLGITKLVDRILVFKDGRIMEDGSHEELMEKRGHYYNMYLAQASWYQK